jgi:hypothetical protein
MKDNYKLGTFLAAIGILTGLLTFYLMASIYYPVIDGKIISGRPDEAVTVQIVYAVLGWVGVAAGAIWGPVLYGFANRQKWAWFWGTVAATFQLLVGFFPMIPAASIGLPTHTIMIFIPAVVLWFTMLMLGGVHKNMIILTFIAGLAFVLTFMDGVASISKFQTNDDPFLKGMYIMAQQVNWWGAWAWAVFIFAVLKRKKWAIPLGIFAGMMSMIGGYPLGILNVFEVARFSMFLPAPLISTGLIMYLISPAARKLIEDWNEAEEGAKGPIKEAAGV